MSNSDSARLEVLIQTVNALRIQIAGLRRIVDAYHNPNPVTIRAKEVFEQLPDNRKRAIHKRAREIEEKLCDAHQKRNKTRSKKPMKQAKTPEPRNKSGTTRRATPVKT
jgi:TRAP-type C4-dicarboxylate transport system substrate-binding protein